MFITELSAMLLGADLNETVCNIVAFLSLINLVGFLFLMVGSFIGNSRR